ncbi:hypothetical protein WA026_016897 [Henosepilachna vigintioctopunctata]|uniref:RRM domain-containing protein n=1 Tax=Henosepilachna vigintioctopunctata TaxID=420089 RepID=A0AAW1UD20_9CUCU
MSRLIVKNLPKIVTEDRLNEIFSQHGVVTDIQLKYKNGKFREFAFIGYQNENEAIKAVESLNDTFISTRKIKVELCSLLGDPTKPQSWSKYSTDSTAYKKKHKLSKELEDDTEQITEGHSKISEVEERLERYKDDPLFEEFLEVHSKEAKAIKKIMSKSKLDVEIEKESQTAEQEERNDGIEEEKLANHDISDMEYMKLLMEKSARKKQTKEKKVKEKVNFFTVKLKGLPYNCKKKDLKQFFKPLKLQSIRIPPKIHGIAYVGFKDEKKFDKALFKDKSFISGHQISVMRYGMKNITDEVEKQDNTHQSRWVSQEESIKNEEEIAESGRIFLRNLAYTTTEDDLKPLFEKYGPLTELNLPIDRSSRKMKGFGTVTFLMPEHAVKAYSDLDGSIFQGRMLHLLPAKAKDSSDNNNLEESSNYKQKKASKLKSQSGMSHNWNALFLGHDAVAEVVADTFRTDKAAVVGPEAKGSAAVRLALGETQIVAQTKKYLEQEGVILDAFSTPNSKRSKTTILVKNLPSKTNVKEIRSIFEIYGIIGRIILPPSGITAIVEFVEASEARKAFTNLAYSKFKNMPLYLEWAPENSLQERTSVSHEEIEPSKPEVSENTDLNEEKEESDEEEPEPDTTIFVKNLNFKTTEAELKKHFTNCGKIHYASIATKKDKNNPSVTLSMGYGFVRFKTKDAADKALKSMQQTVLDGKSLELKRSERTLQSDVVIQKKTTKRSKQNGTKIVVRNVPFQAKDKELGELFSVFGTIKSLRMPKKLSGDTHRGFAFVDFVTTVDAKKAFEALSQSTHLYGRRLVLEWAEDDGKEKTGKRSAEHFHEDNSRNKKSKKSVLTVE